MHYVFPPAPTISLTINGGMEMPGWFDLYDWPIGVRAKDDREGKIAAAKQIEEVRRMCIECVCFVGVSSDTGLIMMRIFLRPHYRQ